MLETARFNSADEVQRAVLSEICRRGSLSSPRGLVTREIEGVTFTLDHPRRRCTTNRARKWSLPFALGEFAWHLSRSDEVEPLLYYSKNWGAFVDDTNRIAGSCYGRKIFADLDDGESQWSKLIALLSSDPASRRAVLTFWDPLTALSISRKDVPCTSTMQFMIRDGALNAYVSMRSNDAIWGLPYDLFFFTMTHELLAREIGVPLGTYTHSATSLHLYERHFALAARMLAEPIEPVFEMDAMGDPSDIDGFTEAERFIRVGAAAAATQITSHLHPYWRGLLDVLSWFNSRKLTPPDQQGSEAPWRLIGAPSTA